MKKTITLICSLLAASHITAAADYFPLEVGNSWVYRSTGGRIELVTTISVTGKDTVDGRDTYQVDISGRSLKVRRADDGSLYATPEGGTERLWLPFAAVERQRTASEFDACTKSATLVTRTASVEIPAGKFDNALRLTYEPSCADAGITSQTFAPGIGLVEFEETSLLGGSRYRLVYSRTGTTNLDAQQFGLTMTLDRPVYDRRNDSEMIVRLTFRNTSSEPIELNFTSGQSYDLRLWNESGEVGYVWSADKLFPQVIRNEKVGPGERTFSFTAPISQLPAGRYAAEGYLTTQSRLYSSILHFEVR